jgi:hypothetical protein
MNRISASHEKASLSGLNDASILTRGVEGLVLTEWKVADDATSAAKGFAKLGLRPTSAGVVYRHINIVVQPAVPSKAARGTSPLRRTIKV